MTLEEYLAVPYKLISYAAQDESGAWKRRAHYPEIDTWADADTLPEAIELLEERRVDYIVDGIANGAEILVPRPPLRSLMRQLTPDVVRDVQRRIREASATR
jgi:hypothetical protein